MNNVTEKEFATFNREWTATVSRLRNSNVDLSKIELTTKYPEGTGDM